MYFQAPQNQYLGYLIYTYLRLFLMTEVLLILIGLPIFSLTFLSLMGLWAICLAFGKLSFYFLPLKRHIRFNLNIYGGTNYHNHEKTCGWLILSLDLTLFESVFNCQYCLLDGSFYIFKEFSISSKSRMKIISKIFSLPCPIFPIVNTKERNLILFL